MNGWSTMMCHEQGKDEIGVVMKSSHLEFPNFPPPPTNLQMLNNIEH